MYVCMYVLRGAVLLVLKPAQRRKGEAQATRTPEASTVERVVNAPVAGSRANCVLPQTSVCPSFLTGVQPAIAGGAYGGLSSAQRASMAAPRGCVPRAWRANVRPQSRCSTF